MASLPSNGILQAVTLSSSAVNGTTYAIDNTVFTTGSPDWTVIVEMSRLDAGDIARFSIQDSVDNFTTPVSGPTFELAGPVTILPSKRYSFTRKDFPGLRFGVASAVMRVSLTLLQGISPRCQWASYYQGPTSN